MNNSKIEWTDATWNPVTGCTKVSQGCKNCYAEKIHDRFNGKGSFKNVTAHRSKLEIPLKWKKPKKIFVNSMSDLFHEDVSFSFIYDVFLTMENTPIHTYQILTKRPQRMIEFYKYAEIKEPLPNVWLGVSVEDQATADERIPLLLQVPAAIHFLSCEPLLGAINLEYYKNGTVADWLYKIQWIIAGGESGPSARPMHPDWVRSLRDQCMESSIPFFFKQWGEYYFCPVAAAISPDILLMNDGTQLKPTDENYKSGITARMFKWGKKKAGRLLDGKEYNDFPAIEQNSP